MFKNLHLHARFFSQRAMISPPTRHPIGRALVAFLLLLPLFLFSSNAVQAADGDPTLSIGGLGTTFNVMGDTTFTLPISFADSAEPNEISAVSFSLDFDETCLTFDSITDTNADNIPDAITGLPTGYVPTLSYDEADTDGEIDMSIIDQVEPQNALSDGVLVVFEFTVLPACRGVDITPVDGNLVPQSFFFSAVPVPTFGNLTGQDVVGGTHTDGELTLRFNADPTDIALSNATINENLPLGTTIGTLSSTDFDIGSPRDDSHTYSLVAGDGDTNNSSFAISGSALKSNTALNFETKSSYSVRVLTTDSYGGTFDKAFTINVGDVNEKPTALTIDDSNVNENDVADAIVGSFATTDPDTADSFTYSLVAGSGDTGNTLFNIDGADLRANASFNYESKTSHNIRVQVTDKLVDGLTFDNIFTINVVNVNDLPIAVADDTPGQVEVITAAKTFLVLANDTDEDRLPADTLTVADGTISAPTDGGTAVADGGGILYTPPGTGVNGPVSFAYSTFDGTDPSAAPASVTFQSVKNDLRGNCNGDAGVNAGDFPALVLEINDATNDTPDWYNAYTGSFVGSPMGCDANNDKEIKIADLTCTVLISFGDSNCTLLTAQAASTLADADLAVGQNLVGVRNHTVNVPIRLTTNDHRVSAASFALNFDQNQLVFDATDADQNGLPDAITFSTPPGMVTVANYNEAANRLELTVYAVSVPMATLSDGLVANVTFTVNSEMTVDEAPIILVNSSLGSDQGQAVPVEVHSASVRVAQFFRFFLPFLSR